MLRRVSLPIAVFVLWLAGTAAAAEPAALTLSVENRPDGTVLLTGTVTDAKRAPVPDATATFKVRTTFGWLVAAEATTDRLGRATAVLSAVPRSNEIIAEAEVGTTTLRVARFIDQPTIPVPRIRPGAEALSEFGPQPGLISPYPIPLEVAFLIVVLGGVWTTYAFVVSLLVKIRRVPHESPRIGYWSDGATRRVNVR